MQLNGCRCLDGPILFQRLARFTTSAYLRNRMSLEGLLGQAFSLQINREFGSDLSRVKKNTVTLTHFNRENTRILGEWYDTIFVVKHMDFERGRSHVK